jgi:hypothetical protein
VRRGAAVERVFVWFMALAMACVGCSARGDDDSATDTDRDRPNHEGSDSAAGAAANSGSGARGATGLGGSGGRTTGSGGTIDAGGSPNHSRNDGGASDASMAFPPVGPPVTVTAQRNPRLVFRDSSTICWIDAHRDLRCRTAGGLEKIEQTGPFAALAIDPYRGAHGCALRDDGTIACFGFEGAPLALCDPSSMWPCIGGGEPPSGHYIAISAGYGFSCAIAESGAISCWGDDSQNQASTPPAGTDFVGLTSAYEGSCAWTKAGEVQCWGFVFPAPEPSGPVKQLVLGIANINSCWLLESGLVNCDAFSIPDGTPFEHDPLARIGAGNSAVCALDGSGHVKCAGNRFLTRTKPPLGPFLEVATQRGAACGLRGDDVVECWGDGWGNGSGSEVCGVSETRLAIDGAAERVLHGEWRPLGSDQATDTWRFETGFYGLCVHGRRVRDNDRISAEHGARARHDGRSRSLALGTRRDSEPARRDVLHGARIGFGDRRQRRRAERGAARRQGDMSRHAGLGRHLILHL